jgi:UDP-N-acetylmuramate dehydrogenase
MASGIGDFRTTIERLVGMVKEFFPLAKLTTVKVGGKARFFTEVGDEETLKNLIKELKKREIEYFILGNGSNVLFSENTFPGLIIKLGKGFSYVRGGETNCLAGTLCGAGTKSKSFNYLEVGAGTPLGTLVRECFDRELMGTEFLWGIPGTVGGAIVTNAGAFGSSFSDILERVRIITDDGAVKELSKKEIQFGYRECTINPPSHSPLYQKRISGIVLAAVLRLERGAKRLTEKKIAKFLRYRKKTQPTGPSFGCCFKNPPGISAGKLIDLAGLKGRRVGGAYISKKHANFLLNDGSARFTDFYQLIELIKFYVEKRSGILLEEEVRIVY